MKTPMKPAQAAQQPIIAAHGLQSHFTDSDELCEYMAELSGGNTLLAFSCGKDSIVAWLKLRKYFKKIVPYYMYCVPNLEFVEKSLRYYEDWFGCHIARMPHPSLYRCGISLWIKHRKTCEPSRKRGCRTLPTL